MDRLKKMPTGKKRQLEEEGCSQFYEKYIHQYRDYGDWYVDSIGSLDDIMDRSIFNLLRLNQREVVLDAGSSTGRLSFPLCNLSKRVLAGDLSRTSTKVLGELAQERGFNNLDAVAFNIMHLPFADESVDRVLCIEVIQHLVSEHERIVAANEMRRILKPDGFLVLTVYRWDPEGDSYVDENGETISKLRTFANGIPYLMFRLPEIVSFLKKGGFRRIVPVPLEIYYRVPRWSYLIQTFRPLDIGYFNFLQWLSDIRGTGRRSWCVLAFKS